MLTREHLARAAHSRLHFIHDQHDPMLVADASQPIQKTLRRGHVTTFTLHGFNYDRGDFFRWRSRLEQTLLDPVERALARSTVATVSRVKWIAKLARVGHVHNVERLAFEPFALRCARGCERE